MPAGAGSMVNDAAISGDEPDSNAGNDSSFETTTVEACPAPSPVVTAPISVPSATPGLTASVPDNPGHTATWMLAGGLITGGQGTSQVTFESGDPGTTMLLSVFESLLGCDSAEASRPISVDFLDVPPEHPFHDFINTIKRNQVTAGCLDGKSFCPDASVTRGEMAVFLLKALLGFDYVPPAATGIFDDVPPGYFARDWVEDLYNRGITGGCVAVPLQYCPDRPVTRAEMAVFLLKTEHGTGYQPPDCAGMFSDVPCPATPEFPYSNWVERLLAEGITGGCDVGPPPRYCPEDPNTRGQMAVFLILTFLSSRTGGGGGPAPARPTCPPGSCDRLYNERHRSQ